MTEIKFEKHVTLKLNPIRALVFRSHAHFPTSLPCRVFSVELLRSFTPGLSFSPSAIPQIHILLVLLVGLSWMHRRYSLPPWGKATHFYCHPRCDPIRLSSHYAIPNIKWDNSTVCGHIHNRLHWLLKSDPPQPAGPEDTPFTNAVRHSTVGGAAEPSEGFTVPFSFTTSRLLN